LFERYLVGKKLMKYMTIIIFQTG